MLYAVVAKGSVAGPNDAPNVSSVVAKDGSEQESELRDTVAPTENLSDCCTDTHIRRHIRQTL